MSRIVYEEWKPGADALATLRQADAICREYREQGYDLTLRQLYYQFVARGLIPNNQRSYKRLGDVVNRGRMAGLLDWDYITDRTRNLRHVPHWNGPAALIDVAARQYARDKWVDGPTRVEVWVEKEALAGIVQRAADAADVAWFACRGYVSQSEMWAAAQRHMAYLRAGQNVVVLHLGDHDPSGIDMTRDIEDRLTQFMDHDWLRAHPELIPPDATGVSRAAIRDDLRGTLTDSGNEPLIVRRLALNWDQVERFRPPPNPAKLTDSRASGYVREFGYQSWELDALDPAMLNDLISDAIADYGDASFDRLRRHEEAERDLLTEASDRWTDVVELLGGEA